MNINIRDKLKDTVLRTAYVGNLSYMLWFASLSGSVCDPGSLQLIRCEACDTKTRLLISLLLPYQKKGWQAGPDVDNLYYGMTTTNITRHFCGTCLICCFDNFRKEGDNEYMNMIVNGIDDPVSCNFFQTD